MVAWKTDPTPGKMINQVKIKCKMKGKNSCSGRCLGRNLQYCTRAVPVQAVQCQLAPALSGQRGFPDNGTPALYIIRDLQNKLKGLENPPAIVSAQSLLNFLV